MEGLSVGRLRRAVETDAALDDALVSVFLGERTLALNACAPCSARLGDFPYLENLVNARGGLLSRGEPEARQPLRGR